ncbi:MAG: sulfite exporter TauE/SafE family protein [Rhodospirillaceae bacterium]|nr:sulfite exporter TauE/SafE family protein [Rhodospirillaceae bacterium]
MFDSLIHLTGLPVQSFAIAVAAVFTAGLVRGFAGFGLSAILMASIVTIIPPVELIPICYILEGAASIAMFRGGMKDADMTVVWGLVIGSAIGVPIGLFATTTIDPELSKLIALLIIFCLTAAQLFHIRPKFLATKMGLSASGVTAGIATGLASVGGMVVALYVLARRADAKIMRASLVMFLFIGMFTSLVYLLLYDVMNLQAFWRGVILSPVVLVGVFLGSLLFRPSLAHLYKRVCLLLLISLCLLGLGRQIF